MAETRVARRSPLLKPDCICIYGSAAQSLNPTFPIWLPNFGSILHLYTCCGRQNGDHAANARRAEQECRPSDDVADTSEPTNLNSEVHTVRSARTHNLTLPSIPETALRRQRVPARTPRVETVGTAAGRGRCSCAVLHAAEGDRRLGARRTMTAGANASNQRSTRAETRATHQSELGETTRQHRRWRSPHDPLRRTSPAR